MKCAKIDDIFFLNAFYCVCVSHILLILFTFIGNGRYSRFNTPLFLSFYSCLVISVNKICNLQVNWTLFFSVAMPIELTDDEEIVIYAISYLEKMTEFLVNTPKRYI